MIDKKMGNRRETMKDYLNSPFAIIGVAASMILVVVLFGISAPINDQIGADFVRFIGRFHVLILHFPIVLILCAPLADLISHYQKIDSLKKVSPFLWAAAALCSFFTAILGLLLAGGEGYAADTVQGHRFAGVSLAVITIAVAALRISAVSFSASLLMRIYAVAAPITVLWMFVAAHEGGNLVRGESYLIAHAPKPLQMIVGYEEPILTADLDSDPHFVNEIQPVFKEHCFSCHGPTKQKGNMRLDILNPDMVNGHDGEKWHEVLSALNSGDMPPKEQDQPSDMDREKLVAWLTGSLKHAAEAKAGDIKPVLRRLTKAQYTNTLQELLGVNVNFGDSLPNDGKSKMGFTNNGEVLQTSPLHLDLYQSIARDALTKAINIGERPESIRFRIRFGKDIGTGSIAAETGGFQSKPLSTNDFVVEVLNAKGEVVEPASEDAEKAITDFKKSVSVGFRGSESNRYRVVEDGVVMFGAVPHAEIAPRSWQGPSPNLMVQLKNTYPTEGDFMYRVRASSGYFPEKEKEFAANVAPAPKALLKPAVTDKGYDPGYPERALIIPASAATGSNGMEHKNGAITPIDVTSDDNSISFEADIPAEGYYQIDIVYDWMNVGLTPRAKLNLGEGLVLEPYFPDRSEDDVGPYAIHNAGVAYLQPGKHDLKIGGKFFIGMRELVLTPVEEDYHAVRQFNAGGVADKARFSGVDPTIRVFSGSRTDDGIDYREYAQPLSVSSPLNSSDVYSFKGRLEDMPLPVAGNAQADQAEFGAIGVFGLWNDYLVTDASQAGPPLLVEEIEFEGPYIASWPSSSHEQVFTPRPSGADDKEYAEIVVTQFAEKAFRRPVSKSELEGYLSFWEAEKDQYETFEEGVKEVLVAMLSSPKFLYIAPAIQTKGAAEHQPQHNFAARLSYFLWNSPPDEQLLRLAEAGTLKDNIDAEVSRMLKDPKSWRFIRPFADEWLRIDRHKTMIVDPVLYPSLTRFVKRDMMEETYHFLRYVFTENQPVSSLVSSDFAMLNQNLAGYYGVAGVTGSAFRPVPLNDQSAIRGGLLSQGAFLAGHSDGRDAHPIKRAVWVMEKILGNEPPPPPPNVPELDPDTPGFEKLTLKEQLELHRDKPSCRSCHQKIDPYGLVFQNYDAGGLWREEAKGRNVDASSILPDGHAVDGVEDLKNYLMTDKRDDVSRALIKHLLAYAIGRDLSFADEPIVDELLDNVKSNDYRLQSVISSIVQSAVFVQELEG